MTFRARNTRLTAALGVLGAATLLLVYVPNALTQQPPPKTKGKAAMPEPLVSDDHSGFTSIFDGKSLRGWDGDPAFWRAEDGAIVGESTSEKPLKINTFIIWRGGQPRDFELK